MNSQENKLLKALLPFHFLCKFCHDHEHNHQMYQNRLNVMLNRFNVSAYEKSTGFKSRNVAGCSLTLNQPQIGV